MINILYRDKYIAVCEKPSGMLSEGDGKDSLPAILSEELSENGKRAEIFTVHRLDRETRGVMVYALTQKAAGALSEAIARRFVKKEYIAAVVGRLPEDRGEMTDLLFYDRQRNKSFTVKRERKGVKAARLEYELISYNECEKISEYRVILDTGRTHQIRVQFASRGCPLVGDRKYGAPAADRKEASLVAKKLSFPHPVSGEEMTFEL